VIGSLASGTASWWAERASAGPRLAAARAEAVRARGHQLHPGEAAAVTHTAAVTQDTAAVTQAGVTRPAAGRHRPSRPRRRWAGPAAFIAAAFIGCAIVVTLLEGVAGKPLSAVVQGKPGHGTTFGGGAVGKAAPASPSPAPSSSPSPTPSASATGTAAAHTTPSGASSSPAPSTAPATAPGSTLNSVTPSAAPTGTAR
jgi:hypothetical protein